MTNKKDILYSLLVLLFLLNGILVFKLFSFHAPDENRRPAPPYKILVDRLKFTKAQTEALDTIYLGREEELHDLAMHLRTQKNNLFEYSKTVNYDPDKVAYLTNDIGATMAKMDTKVFEILRGMRMICDEKQKIKFDALFKEIFHREGRKQHIGMKGQ